MNKQFNREYAVRKAEVHFNTANYFASHLKEPSGHGRWAFRFDNDEVEFYNGTYVEAKRQACDRARSLADGFMSIIIVKVLS